jgi:biopolymer transport protein ExbD
VKLADESEGDEFAPNLTSMTDIVFLMLVFFMLATTFVDPEKALAIELPGASSASDAPAEELVINVLEDGTYVVGGTSLDAEGLRARLVEAARGGPDMPVTIRGHRLARHEAIVTAMDACQELGLTNLSVGTSPRERS